MNELVGNAVSGIPMSALVALGAGLLRSIAGWGENALRDNKIEGYEWKQLIGTVIKYFSFIFMFSFGLPIDQSLIATLGLDVVQGALKNKNGTA